MRQAEGLEVRGLTKEYNRQPAVRDVSFHLAPGEVLGYVPEAPFVYLYLTGRLRGMDERLLNAKIDSMLDLLWLYEHRYSPIAAYSKGVKQKVLITAALLRDTLIGLDVTTALVFRNLVRTLAARQGHPLRARGRREGLHARSHPAPRRSRRPRLGPTPSRPPFLAVARGRLRSARRPGGHGKDRRRHRGRHEGVNMKRQFRELFRLFFGRFLENDLICLDRDTTGRPVQLEADVRGGIRR